MTRTVRLDAESERALDGIRNSTGLSISEALKQGLLALEREVRGRTDRSPVEIYAQLDLGPGGYAVAPSTETQEAASDVIRRKHGR